MDELPIHKLCQDGQIHQGQIPLCTVPEICVTKCHKATYLPRQVDVQNHPLG